MGTRSPAKMETDFNSLVLAGYSTCNKSNAAVLFRKEITMSLPQECPVGKPKKKTPKKNLEAHVVRECLAFLKQSPDVLYVERRNTGAVQFQDGGFIRFGSKGAADIWCLVKIGLMEMILPANEDAGYISRPSDSYLVRHVEVEAKRADGKGRQSADQKKFQEFCDSHRIPYILVTSADELKSKIAAIVLDE